MSDVMRRRQFRLLLRYRRSGRTINAYTWGLNNIKEIEDSWYRNHGIGVHEMFELVSIIRTGKQNWLLFERLVRFIKLKRLQNKRRVKR